MNEYEQKLAGAGIHLVDQPGVHGVTANPDPTPNKPLRGNVPNRTAR
jgi:hypothetical protein